MENELLIISSNHRSRIGLATGFASYGYTVSDVLDLAQADHTIRNHGAPRMIILDVHGRDRRTLSEFITHHLKHGIRFIALGMTTDDYALAQELGAEEVLPLPHHLHDMREYVLHISSYLNAKG